MNEIDRHLQSDDLLPIYGIVSSDTTLVLEAVAAIRARTLDSAPDFNQNEFRADEDSVAEILVAARTVPMMARKRFVHVARVEKLKAAGQELLANYVKEPAAHTVLVFSGEKLDRRRKLGQAIAKSKALFTLGVPKTHQLADWIERRSARRQLPITHGAAQLLADLIGSELGALDRTIEQLWLYAGGERTIEEYDVEAFVAPTRLRSIFELTDAIGKRDLPLARRRLREALRGGENALLVLAMVARQLRQWLRHRTLAPQRMRQSELARAIGAKPFLMAQIAEQAARFESAELVAGLHATHRADIALKGSKLADGAILDRLVGQLIAHDDDERISAARSAPSR